ncbi:MAG: hypothetical protein KAW17_02480 [Candidatus Eisenbacteria sp.]|nr:hypothetical protein [Candidatus Eisenbacteria bacterium]
MHFYWIVTAIAGFAGTVLGFFMLGWKELKGLAAGGPYVVLGAISLPFAHHLGPVSGRWSAFVYVLAVFSMLFGLIVLADERRARGWFVCRYWILAAFWLVLSVGVPDVTSSMRMFPVLMGLGYVGIAIGTGRAPRLTGGHVGFDIALNAIILLFLGILMVYVPDFFTNQGVSIWKPTP